LISGHAIRGKRKSFLERELSPPKIFKILRRELSPRELPSSTTCLDESIDNNDDELEEPEHILT